MATYPDGTLVKASGPEIAQMEDGMRRWIPDPATFNCMGLNWNAVQTITDAEWNQIPQGNPYLSRADGMLYDWQYDEPPPPALQTIYDSHSQYAGLHVMQACSLYEVWQPGMPDPVGEIKSGWYVQTFPPNDPSALFDIPLGSGTIRVNDPYISA